MMKFSVLVSELVPTRWKPPSFVMRVDSNRKRYDRTPHAEQYHLPVKTRSIHAPVRMAFIAPSSHQPRSSRLVLLCGSGALGTSGCADAESVAELAGDGLEVSHATGTGSLPSLGLLAPVDCHVLLVRVLRQFEMCAMGDVHLRVLAAG